LHVKIQKEEFANEEFHNCTKEKGGTGMEGESK
jgi:hypothetical protein